MGKVTCASAFGITVDVGSDHAAYIFHALMAQTTRVSLYNLNRELLFGLKGAAGS